MDIFYHHRMDPETPLEETMETLAQIVRSGKALYVGISNYDGEHMKQAAAISKSRIARILSTRTDIPSLTVPLRKMV